MIKPLGHDVLCDLCGANNHCAYGQPWPHSTVYVTTHPRSAMFDDMLQLHLCKKCWPEEGETEEVKTILKKFIAFFRHTDSTAVSEKK